MIMRLFTVALIFGVYYMIFNPSFTKTTTTVSVVETPLIPTAVDTLEEVNNNNNKRNNGLCAGLSSTSRTTYTP
jgi:hypothetical protein